METMQIELEAGVGSIRRSRRWVVQRAQEHGLSDDSTRVLELLTSELVTNAVKYGPPGGVIILSTERSAEGLRVAVADDETRAPTIRAAGPSDVGGRGIQLVDMLAAEWGVERVADEGKIVWFSVAV